MSSGSKILLLAVFVLCLTIAKSTAFVPLAVIRSSTTTSSRSSEASSSPASRIALFASCSSSAANNNLSALTTTLQSLLDQGASKESILSRRLLLPPLFNATTTTTRIGKSHVKNAGRGLFACRDILKGELITCYPGDGVITLSKDDEEDDDEDDLTVTWGTHVHVSDWCGYDVNDHDNNTQMLSNSLSGYVLQVSEEYAIVGLPYLDRNPMYRGHFANDGACLYYLSEEANIASYVLESNDMANARHQSLLDCHMITVATRNIPKGQEILVTYGPDYWMEHAASSLVDDDSSSSSNESEEEDEDNASAKTTRGNGKGFG